MNIDIMNVYAHGIENQARIGEGNEMPSEVLMMDPSTMPRGRTTVVPSHQDWTGNKYEAAAMRRDTPSISKQWFEVKRRRRMWVGLCALWGTRSRAAADETMSWWYRNSVIALIYRYDVSQPSPGDEGP